MVFNPVATAHYNKTLVFVFLFSHIKSDSAEEIAEDVGPDDQGTGKFSIKKCIHDLDVRHNDYI